MELIGGAVWGLLLQLGVGGVLGFLAGYALKKLAKLVAIGAGLLVLALMLLNYYGVVNVDWTRLTGLGEEALKMVKESFAGVAGFVLQNIPFAGSFTVGFLVGLKKG